jgi:hypothetical protein
MSFQVRKPSRWYRQDSEPGFWIQRLKFGSKFILLQAIIISVTFVCGSFQEIRRDDSGWCAHFNGWMVCNDKAITDYTLGE